MILVRVEAWSWAELGLSLHWKSRAFVYALAAVALVMAVISGRCPADSPAVFMNHRTRRSPARYCKPSSPKSWPSAVCCMGLNRA